MTTAFPPGFRIFARLSLFFLAAVLWARGTAGAQPFGEFLLLTGPSSGYVEVPSSSDLNPTDAFTFEAWVKLTNSSGASCSSIAGKNWQQAWWVGLCGTTLRSYLRGSTSLFDGGEISSTEWTHIAVVFDGAQHIHYINGESVATRPETGPLTTSTSPMRIGSDVQYAFTPAGVIDEVRLWSVARTQDQIRSGLMSPITATTPGLLAVWSLDHTPNDAVGGHSGTLNGSANYGFNGTGPSCAVAASSTAMCLLDRFLVTSRFRAGAPGTAEADAQVVGTPSAASGLFWFFSADNWEVMVKSLNGCSIFNTYWVFSAATTNVFYRLDVSDYHSGNHRIYFNYPGPPAPAVTDTAAFATCP
jgi:Concanavalin A-like lectin/glucanases superfamily